MYKQDLHEENDKTLLNDMKEELNKCGDIPCSWLKRLNVVKMSVISKLTHGFNAIPKSQKLILWIKAN